MDRLAKTFKILGNERRLRIVELLLSSDRMTVGKISEQMNLSFKSVSKHLQQLQSIGILGKEQVSNHVFYFLAKNSKTFINNDVIKIVEKYLSKTKTR